MKQTIRKLVEAFGPSGYEDQTRSLIRDEIKDLADEIQIDALGSLIARKSANGQAGGLKIMLAAHMDEIGVMVTHVDKQGFLRFASIGGVYPHTLIGGRVRFANGTVGVLHIEEGFAGWRNKALDITKMYIDVGATSPDDCPVGVGDAAGFVRPMVEAGNRLISKSMDDRVACAVLIEVMRQVQETPHEVYFVYSVQEEIGLFGAQTAAYRINPDLGLSVDVTQTGDTPEARPMAVSLGKGPAIKVMDSGMLAHPQVKELMIERAEQANIPYQLEVLYGGTTDAMVIQIARAGVPSGCLSIPCRYVHTPSEMVDYDDLQNSVKLLLEILKRPIDLGL